MSNIFPPRLLLGLLLPLCAFLFLFLPPQAVHADEAHQCRYSIDHNTAVVGSSRLLSVHVYNTGTDDITSLQVIHLTSEGTAPTAVSMTGTGWTDTTSGTDVSATASAPEFNLGTKDFDTVWDFPTPATTYVNVLATSADSSTFYCTPDGDGAFVVSAGVPDPVSGVDITNRDIMLISLGLSIILGYLFIKQFRWRL